MRFIGRFGGRAAGAVIAAVLLLMALAAAAQQPVVVQLRLEGVINPIKARYIKQALEQAQTDGAALVLLSIDTPGGLVASMQDIVGAITNATVPVVGLVEPRTAQATSAGAFILLATDVAAMLPDTRMGAAHPVGAGQPLEGALEDKATNSLVSLAKSLASRRDRSEVSAEEIVRQSVSYTAEEAFQAHLVELIVPDAEALLTHLDGLQLDFPDRQLTLSTRDARLVEVPMSWANRLLDAIADPNIASILLSIGVLGILYELSAPGIGMGGIVGVIAVLLGLLAMSVLPIRLAGFLLLIAGFGAIALEVKAPAHGLLAAGGIIALLIGALVLVDETSYFGASQQVHWQLFLPVVSVVSLGLLGLAAIARRALRSPPQTGIERLVGASGVVKASLQGSAGVTDEGMVLVDGARWRAVSEEPIGLGEPIEVIDVLRQPTRLRVKPVVKGAS